MVRVIFRRNRHLGEYLPKCGLATPECITRAVSQTTAARRAARSSPATANPRRTHAHLRGTFGQNFLTAYTIRRNRWSLRRANDYRLQ
jgi:hypothetical protein